MKQDQSGKLTVLRFNIFERFKTRLQAGITTRRGGVSRGPFAGLNLADHVGDSPAAVKENRRLLCGACGLDYEHYVFVSQIHGNAIIETEKSANGNSGEADGILSNSLRVTTSVYVADCVPVILYDPVVHAGAVLHAGWRGTALGIMARGVDRMRREYGSRPGDILAGIGPCINADNYEVGTDVINQIGSVCEYAENPWRNSDSGRYLLDLEKANMFQLADAGLAFHKIETSGMSCSDPELFYSYRRDGGTTGRFSAFLMLC